mmetsp:Transcript_77198/g.226426  ORF Transcript_77198/g.226426 Transcript_77198/m.226426 type:complete len:381 (+) Transcript_77198:378-1520(+)
MLLPQLVQDQGAVGAAVLCQRHGDDLQRAGKVVDHQLLLAGDGPRVLPQVAAQLHLDGAPATNDLGVPHGGLHDQQRVLQRALRLVDELLGPAPDEDGRGIRAGALREEVVALRPDLPLLELAAGAEDAGRDALDRGLDLAAGGPPGALQVVLVHPAGAEDVAVGEVLGGQVPDGQAAEHHLRPGLGDEVQLLVDDVPLSVDDGLVLVGVRDADLSVVLLRLELELEVEQQDLGVRELLGLLLEARVREGLLEGHALDQRGVGDRAAGHLLDAHRRDAQVVPEHRDGVHRHLCEERLVVGHELRVQGRLRALDEHRALLLRTLRLEVDRHLAQLLQRQVAGSPEALDDLRAYKTILKEVLRLLQHLPGQNDNAGGAVAYF